LWRGRHSFILTEEHKHSKYVRTSQVIKQIFIDHSPFSKIS
jgi:hypothetical protein